MEYVGLYLCGFLGQCLSLVDVAVLTSLSLFGDTHAIGVAIEGEDKKKLDFLSEACLTRGSLTTRLHIFLGQVFRGGLGEEQ